MLNPLPDAYYYFFWLVEPALTVAGAGYAIFQPGKYGADLLPPGIETMTTIMGDTTRGQMVIGGLGSCFLLLAMISLSLFPLMRKHLAHIPAVQDKMVKGLLAPLAIADLIHIALTLLPLPMSLLKSPSRWTALINGNVWITLGLFAIRSAWFLGIGRGGNPSLKVSTPVKASTPPRNILVEEDAPPVSASPASASGRTRGRAKKLA